ncbi:type II toxin-antitoxin system RelE/ParE family toxin [Enterococcus hulanensis]|uniref:Type II toxin-antitoxin system RelE/ParE family toxin n=1 Tax=Enterococcus hulanensis TaxID=2559929 RepID=A0ABU3EV02_9ENTE|nr:type II toxin-antitoxin system RelE/ParE family toxin [Enterococcus hulanensis]MDT2598689.1 type II toxin-antitoxin system RelE/ParE family toxin [Enterococcus hulanensis]MDT2607806.1 type II toxin-antitoxin system RelE/ParE family toxin [Enterococcus hulanensis]MDT2615101.1 type II toxin-antitoxin system RelE/ParE family toxin [Enterococcus hulanensis]MDT2626928.1 type II toxin-antitoxin system RelE/ParE family toxin [Enterococcus hulanensis]MDT2654173.1 type II toxin-antitoxin system RelE
MTKHYLVRYEKAAQKALKKMDRFQASMIISWIEKNLVGTDNPRQHGKGLVANRSGEWRYRIGDYRLIANINDESVTILIVQIAHRSTIYK